MHFKIAIPYKQQTRTSQVARQEVLPRLITEMKVYSKMQKKPNTILYTLPPLPLLYRIKTELNTIAIAYVTLSLYEYTNLWHRLNAREAYLLQIRFSHIKQNFHLCKSTFKFCISLSTCRILHTTYANSFSTYTNKYINLWKSISKLWK